MEISIHMLDQTQIPPLVSSSYVNGGSCCLVHHVHTVYCDSMYHTRRFIGEEFILANGDLFDFSPIIKPLTLIIK